MPKGQRWGLGAWTFTDIHPEASDAQADASDI